MGYIRNHFGKYFLLIFLWSAMLTKVSAQDPSIIGDGIEVIIPSETGKILNSYFLINGSYQNPYLVSVPMIPENSLAENYSVNELNGLQAFAEGYSFGLGVMNKTKSFLEVGLLADYFNSTVAITRTGERSMGPWVLEQNNGTGDLTEPFEMNHNRVSEVFVIRACIRLKIPMGPFSIWGGITGGSYTSTVRYTERDAATFLNSASKTLISPSYQAGLDFLIRNKSDKDILSITFFADFHSPKMDEKIYDAVILGWGFEPIDGNNVISPLRFGLAIGIH